MVLFPTQQSLWIVQPTRVFLVISHLLLSYYITIFIYFVSLCANIGATLTARTVCAYIQGWTVCYLTCYPFCWVKLSSFLCVLCPIFLVTDQASCFQFQQRKIDYGCSEGGCECSFFPLLLPACFILVCSKLVIVFLFVNF
jgi:hypothetical protein